MWLWKVRLTEQRGSRTRHSKSGGTAMKRASRHVVSSDPVLLESYFQHACEFLEQASWSEASPMAWFIEFFADERLSDLRTCVTSLPLPEVAIFDTRTERICKVRTLSLLPRIL